MIKMALFTSALCIILCFYMCSAAKTRGCKEQCIFHFDHSFAESQKRCGQITNGRVSIHNKKALFSGFGYIGLPVFESNTLQPYFALAFRFRYLGTIKNAKQPIALISNGCERNQPTLELSLAGNTVTFRLVLTVDEETKEVAVIPVRGIDVTKELHVKIGQTNDRIRIKIDNDQVHVIEKSMHEHIASTQCPLQIGSGFGLVPFVGEIDEFVFYPCINEDFFEKERFP